MPRAISQAFLTNDFDILLADLQTSLFLDCNLSVLDTKSPTAACTRLRLFSTVKEDIYLLYSLLAATVMTFSAIV